VRPIRFLTYPPGPYMSEQEQIERLKAKIEAAE
jgi:hypothetical protein